MYSVAEIIELNLPLLPKSKPAITTKARNEGWVSSETVGLGGVKKLYEIPARYLVSMETMGLPLETAKQAALQAHKSATAMGNVSDEQFLKLFLTLCNLDQPKESPPSASANTQRAKAGKKSVIQQGDGNNINAKTIKGGMKL